METTNRKMHVNLLRRNVRDNFKDRDKRWWRMTLTFRRLTFM